MTKNSLTNTMVIEDQVMTVKKFAAIFNISEASARNIFRASKTLNAYLIGGKWVCDYSDYLNFKERLKKTRDTSLCCITSFNFMQKPVYQNPDIELLSLNNVTNEIIEEVLYGKDEK